MTPNSKVTVTAGGESLSRRPLKTLSMLRGSSESGGRSCRSAIPVRYLRLDDLEALPNDYRVLYSVIICYTISENIGKTDHIAVCGVVDEVVERRVLQYEHKERKVNVT